MLGNPASCIINAAKPTFACSVWLFGIHTPNRIGHQLGVGEASSGLGQQNGAGAIVGERLKQSPQSVNCFARATCFEVSECRFVFISEAAPLIVRLFHTLVDLQSLFDALHADFGQSPSMKIVAESFDRGIGGKAANS